MCPLHKEDTFIVSSFYWGYGFNSLISVFALVL